MRVFKSKKVDSCGKHAWPWWENNCAKRSLSMVLFSVLAQACCSAISKWKNRSADLLLEQHETATYSCLWGVGPPPSKVLTFIFMHLKLSPQQFRKVAKNEALPDTWYLWHRAVRKKKKKKKKKKTMSLHAVDAWVAKIKITYSIYMIHIDK